MQCYLGATHLKFYVWKLLPAVCRALNQGWPQISNQVPTPLYYLGEFFQFFGLSFVCLFVDYIW